MEDTVAWLRDRPYYAGQIADHRAIPGSTGNTVDLALPSPIEAALADRGISSLYEHQVAAIEAVREGDHVVLATPTASGKSLAYTVPAFEQAIEDGGTTLYLGPQVALINDQYETLSALERGLGFGTGVTVDRYTGRLSRGEKRAVRDRRPTMVLSTPDMLHYGLLPHARRLWDWFFDNLSLVVIDEIHDYRGVFGSHVALVLRRLLRLCETFGQEPQFVCCSATIGNPVNHAGAITGVDPDSIRLIDEDTSVSGRTNWVLWNPPVYTDEDRGHAGGRRRSSHVESQRLLTDLVQRGHQTAVFTGARQVAERYATSTADALRERSEHGMARGIAAYHAALSHDRRRQLETELVDGTVRGVWTTNALELGVDIGGLDAVILDGYPGTRMAARQRAGRAGRGRKPSLVVMVAGEDQLDQYVMNHPDAFFDGKPEQAVANPGNDHLVPDHIAAAATESWITPDDRAYFEDSFPSVVADLESAGVLERRSTGNGIRWVYDGGGSPQHELNLRRIGDREIELIDRARGESIAQLGFHDALRDGHPGAVYHHQGRTYEVVDLDLERNIAELASTHAQYYTQVLSEKQVTVEEVERELSLPAVEGLGVKFGSLTVRERITGFERRDQRSGEPRGRESLELPETALETRGLFYTVPTTLVDRLKDEQGSFPGAIHAAEHAMIALFPLQLVCDRRDIGGLSTPHHPDTGHSTVFIYDGYPGGVGLSRVGFDRFLDLTQDTHELVANCPCRNGCPACVQSPYCGNANEPLDKGLATSLLAELIELTDASAPDPASD